MFSLERTVSEYFASCQQMSMKFFELVLSCVKFSQLKDVKDFAVQIFTFAHGKHFHKLSKEKLLSADAHIQKELQTDTIAKPCCKCDDPVSEGVRDLGEKDLVTEFFFNF